MPVATLWFNEIDDCVSQKVIDMIRKYISYMKEQLPDEPIIVVVHRDSGNIEKLFGEIVQVVKITEICHQSQLSIYESGNNFVTMVDHGKHLIIDWLMTQSRYDQLCAVTDLDIVTEPKRNYLRAGLWFTPRMQEMMNKLGIIDNSGENQAYLSRGVNKTDGPDNFLSKVKSLHKSYYIDFLGAKYALLGRKGLLKFDIKRVIMSSYIVDHNSYTDYGPGSIFDLRYGEIFKSLFGTEERFDYNKLLDHEVACYIGSTTLDVLLFILGMIERYAVNDSSLLEEYLEANPQLVAEFKGRTSRNNNLPKVKLPFDPTTFGEDGMTTDDNVFAVLMRGMQNSGFDSAKIRDIISKGLYHNDDGDE